VGAYKVDPMNVRAAMGEQNVEAIGHLIDLVVAAVLHRYGDTQITFSRADLTLAAKEYRIERDVKPDGSWVVRLISTAMDKQPKLFDLEAEKAKYPGTPINNEWREPVSGKSEVRCSQCGKMPIPVGCDYIGCPQFEPASEKSEPTFVFDPFDKVTLVPCPLCGRRTYDPLLGCTFQGCPQ
jgi:hypothetical protein